MNSVLTDRRSRWVLGVLLILFGIALHPGPALAQSAAGDAATPVLRQAAEAGGADNSAAAEPRAGLKDEAVAFLTTPAAAALLIGLGFLLLLVDLVTAGFGIAGTTGLAMLALFFWAHADAGLAGWESMALVGVGLVLLALEVFVIPGFGVAGISGLVALLGGLYLSLVGDEGASREAIVRGGSTIGVAVITVVAGGAALLWLLPHLPWLRGLVLHTNLPVPETAGHDSLILGAALERERPGESKRRAAAEPRSLLGATGVALSGLRPGGYAQIDGVRVDVVTRGDFIPAGAPVEVIADQGYRRVVRRSAPEDGRADRAGAATG